MRYVQLRVEAPPKIYHLPNLRVNGWLHMFHVTFGVGGVVACCDCMLPIWRQAKHNMPG